MATAFEGTGYTTQGPRQGRGQAVHIVNDAGGCDHAVIEEERADGEIIAIFEGDQTTRRRTQQAFFSETKEPGTWHYPGHE